MSESCGKCVPCRMGTSTLYDLLCKFADGRANDRDLEVLEDLCVMVKETSLCGLGQSAPNPVQSTLRYFRDEYLALMKKSEERPHDGLVLEKPDAAVASH